jgi:hypothetical protein
MKALARLATVSVFFLLPLRLFAADTAITSGQLDEAIDQMASFLVRHSLVNGRFVYRINTNPSVKIDTTYNVIRHAGTMYALADYQRHRPQEETARVLKRAAAFLHSQTSELRDVPGVQAVWSDPAVNFSVGQVKAKLGGTGLGLAALTSLEGVIPGSTTTTQLREMGEFLLFMQNGDGDFCSIYNPQLPGREHDWISLYYPGEAALGLLMLHELQPVQAYFDGAYDGLAFLSRSRAGAAKVPADHWALIATAKLIRVAEDQDRRIDRPLLVSHARQICSSMLDEQRPQLSHKSLEGSFVPDGRTTPTATRLEGLLATLSVLPSDSELRPEIERACHLGIKFLFDSRITEGPARGGIPRAVATLPEDSPYWTKAFNPRATEIRMDYVQHALSAFLEYRRVFLEP